MFIYLYIYICARSKFVASRARGSVEKWHKCVSSSFRIGSRRFVPRRSQLSDFLNGPWATKFFVTCAFPLKFSSNVTSCFRIHTHTYMSARRIRKKKDFVVSVLFSVCSLLFISLYCFLAPSPSLSLSFSLSLSLYIYIYIYICLFVNIVYLYIHISVSVTSLLHLHVLTSFYIRFVYRLCTCVCLVNHSYSRMCVPLTSLQALDTFLRVEVSPLRFHARTVDSVSRCSKNEQTNERTNERTNGPKYPPAPTPRLDREYTVACVCLALHACLLHSYTLADLTS